MLFQPTNSMFLIDCGMSIGTKLWESRIKALNILEQQQEYFHTIQYVYFQS